MTSFGLSALLRDIGLVLLLAAFLLPGHYPPWATFESQSIAALGVGFLGLGAAIVGPSGVQRWPALAWLAAATALVPLGQLAAGKLAFLSDAVLPALYLVAFALALRFGQVWGAACRGAWLDRLFGALAAAAIVSVGASLCQWLSLDIGGVWVVALPPGAQPFANLGQANHLASLLALGAIGLWRWYEHGTLSKPVAVLAVAWIGLGLVMTQSRTGWLAMFMLVAWWAVMRRRVRFRAGAVAVLGAAALFAVATLVWAPLNQALSLSAPQSMAERLQPGPRGLIWQLMWEAVTRAPWLGYGWNQAILGQQDVALDFPRLGRMLESAHNIGLDLALYGGVPLALAWFAAMGLWLARQVRRCKDIDRWSVLAAVGALLLHAMLEFPLEQLYFLLPLGLLIGSVSGPDPAVALHAAPRRTAWPLLLMVAAALVALAVVASEYLRVQDSHRQLRFSLAGIGGNRSPSAPPADVFWLDAPREYQRLMATPAREGMSSDELNWMQRVTRRHAFPPAMMRYALAAGLNGRAGEASLTLRRLCALHPAPRCDEARSAWRDAQKRWPALAAIAPP